MRRGAWVTPSGRWEAAVPQGVVEALGNMAGLRLRCWQSGAAAVVVGEASEITVERVERACARWLRRERGAVRQVTATEVQATTRGEGGETVALRVVDPEAHAREYGASGLVGLYVGMELAVASAAEQYGQEELPEAMPGTARQLEMLGRGVIALAPGTTPAGWEHIAICVDAGWEVEGRTNDLEACPAPAAPCAVCWGSGGHPWGRTPCGHEFHVSCAMRWRASGARTCPMCRWGW